MYRRKKKKRFLGTIENQWMNSYSDMVSLLLVFFIVLFSMMRESYKKVEQNDHNYTIQDESSMVVELKKVILSENLENFVFIENHPNGANLRIKEDLLFSSGSYKISEEDSHKIEKVLLLLMDLPEDYEFLIEGHTDDVPMNGWDPAIPTNWHLSIFRAMSVLHLFEKLKLAIPPKEKEFHLSRIGIAGYGDTRPKKKEGDISLEEFRRQNRRIEIKVFSKEAKVFLKSQPHA